MEKRPKIEEQKQKARERGLRWDEKNREYNRERTNRKRMEERINALTMYGGKCACCSEWRYEFLSIDHIEGGGAKHRASLNPADRRDFPRYLRKLGYPQGYRVLCHNCNQSFGLYGYCAHDTTNQPPIKITI